MPGRGLWQVGYVLCWWILAAPAGASEYDDVIDRLQQKECWRHEALRSYEGLRQYVVAGDRFQQTAAMGVRVTYAYPGKKSIQVTWETGSRLLQTRVLRKVIEAELEADGDELRDKVRITPANYTFQPEGEEMIADRRTLRFALTPRTKGKYLVRGRVWIDAADAAVVRLEGTPLGTTSFWVREVRICQEYRRVGPFWLLGSTTTEAQIRFFGPAHLKIDYTQYRVNDPLLARLPRTGGPW